MPGVRALILQGLPESKGLLGVTFRTRCVSGDTVLTTEGTEEIGRRFRWRGDSYIVIGSGEEWAHESVCVEWSFDFDFVPGIACGLGASGA